MKKMIEYDSTKKYLRKETKINARYDTENYKIHICLEYFVTNNMSFNISCTFKKCYHESSIFFTVSSN